MAVFVIGGLYSNTLGFIQSLSENGKGLLGLINTYVTLIVKEIL